MSNTQQAAGGGRVVTEHVEANAAIASLRDVAALLKKLGDGAHSGQVGELQRELMAAERRVADLEPCEDELTRLRDAVADYDRGIIDLNELVSLGREM